MDAALRPYLTAGIAVIGAGAIAATPVAPEAQLPSMQLPSVQLAADFVVADLTDPVDVYSALVTNTFNSIADVGGHWLGDPYDDNLFTSDLALPFLLGVVIDPINNFTSVIHDIGAEVTSGDLLGALGAVVGAPGAITDAVVNGYPWFPPGYYDSSVTGGLLGDSLIEQPPYDDIFTHHPGGLGYFAVYLPQLVLHQLGLGDLVPGSAASTLSALSPESLLDGLGGGLNLGGLLDFNWLNDLLAMVVGAIPL